MCWEFEADEHTFGVFLVTEKRHGASSPFRAQGRWQRA